MTTYKIDWMEKKTTSTGKEKIDATLKEGETSIQNVTIWADFPNFINLMPGSDVEGTLTPAKDPKYGPTLYPPRPASAPRSPNFGMKAAQERKGEMIKEAQDRKEESIAFFNATNSAIAIVSAIYDLKTTPIAPPSLQSEIVKWREWFLKEHKDYKEGLPF